MSENDNSTPYLEHFQHNSGRMERVMLETLPFTIGRSASANFQINSAQVSREHAAIIKVRDDFRVRDLGSTNGTMLNGERVEEASIKDGDVLHISSVEFSFRDGKASPIQNTATQVVDPENNQSPETSTPLSIIRRVRFFHELLAHRCIRIEFQPIVDLKSEQVVAYEALGRGNHRQLSASPTDLFTLATECRLADRLSHLFRIVAVEEAARLPQDVRVFANLHPTEMHHAALLETLRHAECVLPGDRRLVVELQEAAITDLNQVRELQEQLAEWGVTIAFDNFKAGIIRLKELVETVTPDYVKLDMALVRSTDIAVARKRLVQEVIQLSADLGIMVVAKGIETEEQADTFRELGCHLAQGYLFGRPQPVSAILTPAMA